MAKNQSNSRLRQIGLIVLNVALTALNTASFAVKSIYSGIGNLQTAQGLGDSAKAFVAFARVIPDWVYMVVGLATIGSLIWFLLKDAGKGSVAIERAWKFRNDFEHLKEMVDANAAALSDLQQELLNKIDDISTTLQTVTLKFDHSEERHAQELRNQYEAAAFNRMARDDIENRVTGSFSAALESYKLDISSRISSISENISRLNHATEERLSDLEFDRSQRAISDSL